MTIYQPNPVNQFNRLIHVSGSPATGGHVLGSRWNNTHVNPANGRNENWDSRNCTAASTVILLDAQSGGKIQSTPPRIRNAQNDWAGGIGWDDANVAIGRLYPGQGQTLTLPRGMNRYDVLHAIREQRRAVGIQYVYRLLPEKYQAQKGGNFDHASVLAGARGSELLFYDTLNRKGIWIPQSAIFPAMERLAAEQGRSAADLYVAYTKPIPVPATAGVTYKYNGQPRHRGRYLARRDDVPIRSRPSASATVLRKIDHRQSFEARQAVISSSGKPRWLGTADGSKWVGYDVMWFQKSDTSGTEDVQ